MTAYNRVAPCHALLPTETVAVLSVRRYYQIDRRMVQGVPFPQTLHTHAHTKEPYLIRDPENNNDT